jgi:hypothetical protein
MNTWKVIAIGTVGVCALFLLPLYEGLLAGVTAVVVVASVIVGFLLQPRKDVFIVRTALKVWTVDHFVVEQHQIAVKVELARLWLLFVPTLIAVAFLVATAAQGTTWHFTLFGQLGTEFPTGFYIFRVLLFFIVATLSAWLTERWVLRDGNMCNLRTLMIRRRRVSYAFVDSSGGYHGGEGLMIGKVKAKELASLVVYRESKPEQSKTPLTCVFHRFVIVGRGLTDLDEATAGTISPQLAEAPTNI